MFITFEGPEGSGKSTQIKLLVAHLQAQGFAVWQTREPGGTRIGEGIRGVLHDVAHTEMASTAEILLYSAARAQLVAEVIRPKLAAKHVVICDRFYDSTMAYQGYGRGLDLADLRHITHFATGGLTPDLTFLLDIDVEQGLKRRIDGADGMNRLDLESVAFHRRVRAGYHALVTAEPRRWVVIEADQTVNEIQHQLQTYLATRLAMPQLKAKS
jgi:dTMP kinase